MIFICVQKMSLTHKIFGRTLFNCIQRHRMPILIVTDNIRERISIRNMEKLRDLRARHLTLFSGAVCLFILPCLYGLIVIESNWCEQPSCTLKMTIEVGLENFIRTIRITVGVQVWGVTLWEPIVTDSSIYHKILCLEFTLNRRNINCSKLLSATPVRTGVRSNRLGLKQSDSNHILVSTTLGLAIWAFKKLYG